jgi:phosphopantetheinyl transferase
MIDMDESLSDGMINLTWSSKFPCRVESYMMRQQSIDELDLHLIQGDEVKTFATEKRRMDHFNGRRLLENALSKWGLQTLDDIEVLRTEKREPYLRFIQGVWKNLPLPSFSIAHSENYVFVALCETGWSIGIDAEPLARVLSPGVYEFMSSGDELTFLHSHPERALMFWTVKEAVQKSMGQGMHLNPRKIKVPIEKNISNISIENSKIQLENTANYGFQISLALAERNNQPHTAEDALLEETKDAMKTSEWSVGCNTMRRNL